LVFAIAVVTLVGPSYLTALWVLLLPVWCLIGWLLRKDKRVKVVDIGAWAEKFARQGGYPFGLVSFVLELLVTAGRSEASRKVIHNRLASELRKPEWNGQQRTDGTRVTLNEVARLRIQVDMVDALFTSAPMFKTGPARSFVWRDARLASNHELCGSGRQKGKGCPEDS